MINKRWRKWKRQSRMSNPARQAALGENNEFDNDIQTLENTEVDIEIQTLENTEADTHFLVFERKTYLAARILCIFIVGQHLFSFLCDF
jgi:hypothetical protein